MAVPTLLRPQHQLGDFLFQSDMDKLHGNNFPGAMIGGNINMNMMRTSFFAGANFYYSNPTQSASSPLSGKIMNENYANNAQSSGEIMDNAKKSISTEQGPNGERKDSRKKYAEVRKKKYGKKKPGPIMEDVEMIEVSTEDRVKEINLQSEIAKEQEYQDMMNKIYNDPEYFEQHYQSLEYQPALHQAPGPQCEVVIDPSVMQHNPPMYFIIPQHDLQLYNDQPQQALYQPQQQFIQQDPLQYNLENEFHHGEPMKTSTPTAMFLSETSSDYFSDSNPGSEYPSDDEASYDASKSSLVKSLRSSSASPTASDPRWANSSEFCFYGGEFTSSSEDQYSAPGLELDEELNNLVLSIISE